MVKMKRKVAAILAAALCFTSLAGASYSEAAKKPVLSKKKVNVVVGKSVKVSVKIATATAKITWKSSKKSVATVKKAGKKAAKITGKKAGSAVIAAKVKVGKKKYTLKCNVTVKKNGNEVSNDAKEDASATPAASASASATPAASTQPDASKAPATVAPVATLAPVVSSQAPASSFVPVEYKISNFENGTDGWNGRGGAQVSIVEGGHEGNCLKVTGRTDNWHGASLDVSADIVQGGTYKVSAYIKHESASATAIKCSEDLDSNSWPEIAQVDNVPTGEWTLIEGTIKIGEDFGRCSIYFELPNDKTSDFYVDDVVITQIEAPVAGPEIASIKDTYADIFNEVGACVNYDGWRAGKQLQTPKTLEFIKKHFSSITLEDEMKPDAVLGGWNATQISVADAKALGYVIPDSYKDTMVPKLNLDTLDKVIEIAYKNGLKLRGHTFMWHQQTPTWFFTENYGGNTVVSPEVMDGRLEFYIRTVMKHMIEKEIQVSGKAGSVVYAWDVTNEYLHRDNEAAAISWVNVYGDMGLRPTYVKKAFEVAYDMLKQYDLQDKDTLFYNDYDTYKEIEDLITFVNYLNEGEEAKICGGIGMQSHVDVTYPTIERYQEALEAFMATGLEIQITELDITTTFKDESLTEEDQAAYVKEFMEMVIDHQVNRDKTVSPKGITSFTIWGLYDSVSWRGSYGPLFFTSLKSPKPSYYALVEAVKK